VVEFPEVESLMAVEFPEVEKFLMVVEFPEVEKFLMVVEFPEVVKFLMAVEFPEVEKFLGIGVVVGAFLKLLPSPMIRFPTLTSSGSISLKSGFHCINYF
jgi:hypothetical protein